VADGATSPARAKPCGVTEMPRRDAER